MRRPIRVAWLSADRMPATGGTSTYLRQWIRELDRSRFKAFLFTWGEASEIQSFLGECGESTVVNVPSLRHRRWAWPVAILQLAWQLRRNRIDVLHTAGSTNDVIGLAAATLARVPTTVCSILGPLTRPWMPRHLRLWYRVGYSLLRHRADHFVAVSGATAGDAAGFIGLPMDRFTVVPLGVDAGPPISRHDRTSRRIGTVCRLVRVKRVDMLIDAMAILKPSYPDLTCVVAGDGPLKPLLEQRAAALGLGGVVQFGGWQEPAEVLPELDVFVHCSMMEGLPAAILEAMAAGLPVVAVGVGGVPEAVVHGQTGFLVPLGDVQALAHAIRSLLENPEMRAQMGAAGRSRVLEHFRPEAEAAALASMYAGVQGD